MADDIVQVIQDAREDAVSLSQFIYYPANTMVERRLAPNIHTLNYYLDYLKGLELIYSQETGTVTVNGEEVKTVRQAINDSVDSVVLGEYQTQLEQNLNSEVVRATDREDAIEGSLELEISRATGVESTLTQDLAALSLETSAQKLDTGITVTAREGEVERTQADLNARVLTPEDFGAVGDGITDDSIALKKLFSLGKCVALTQGKTYLANIPQTVSVGGLYVQGNGASIVTNTSNTSASAFHFLGGISKNVTHTTNAELPRGSERITLSDTSSLVVGQHIILRNNEYKHGLDGVGGFQTKYKGEFNQVEAISGNQVRLVEPLKDDYYENLNTDTVSFLSNIIFTDTHFRALNGEGNNPDYQDASGYRALKLEYVDRALFKNCSFSNYRRIAIEVKCSKDILLDGNRFLGYEIKDVTNAPYNSNWFTGCYFTSCENVTFVNNFGRNLRRFCDADTSLGSAFTRNINISNNMAVNCLNLVGVHTSENVLVHGNKGTGCGSIFLRCINATVTNNEIRGMSPLNGGYGSGITVGFHRTVNITTEVGKVDVGDVVISNNYIEGSSKYGIAILGNISRAVIKANKVSADDVGIYILGRKTDNIIIKDNDVTSHGGHVVWMPLDDVITKTSFQNLIISDNIFTNTTTDSSSLRIQGTSNGYPVCDNIVISSNIFKGFYIRGVALEGKYPLKSQGQFGSNIQIDNNVFKRAGGVHDAITYLNIIAPSTSNNIGVYTDEPRSISVLMNATYLLGTVYTDATKVGQVGYKQVCTEAGTIGTLDVNVESFVDSNVLRVLDTANIVKLKVGAYIKLGGATGRYQVTEIVNDTLILDRETSFGYRESISMMFHPPVFENITV